MLEEFFLKRVVCLEFCEKTFFSEKLSIYLVEWNNGICFTLIYSSITLQRTSNNLLRMRLYVLL